MQQSTYFDGDNGYLDYKTGNTAQMGYEKGKLTRPQQISSAKLCLDAIKLSFSQYLHCLDAIDFAHSANVASKQNSISDFLWKRRKGYDAQLLNLNFSVFYHVLFSLFI